jgi:hypothetical protein
MKKNRNCSWVISAALVIGFVMAGLILSGCVTSRVFTGGDTPPEQKGQSVIVNGDEITHIDDVPVAHTSEGRINLVIPAGRHTITVSKISHYTVSRETTYEYEYTTYISYSLKAYTAFDFEPGKKYALEDIMVAMKYNGRTLETSTPGVTITTYRDGSVLVDNPGMTVKETGTMLLSTHIAAEFSPAFFGSWSYKDLLTTGLGLRLGAAVIHDKLDLKLMGDAGAGLLGFSFPDFANVGLGFSAYYGGLASVYFSTIGLDLGGGMQQGVSLILSDDAEVEFFITPYLQAGILFRKKGTVDEWGIYGQYYLDAEQWYNKFGLGIKAFSY